MSRERLAWTDERVALLRRLYLEEFLPPATIARRFGVSAHSINCKIGKLGWARGQDPAALRQRRRDVTVLATEGRRRKALREGWFIWTAAREAELRRLYVEVGLAIGQIAERFLTDSKVVKGKVRRMGLTAELRARGGTVSRLHASRRGLMGVAAAGANVVRLSAAHARGVTGWELATGRTAPPEVTEAERAQMDRGRARQAVLRALRRRA